MCEHFQFRFYSQRKSKIKKPHTCQLRLLTKYYFWRKLC